MLETNSFTADQVEHRMLSHLSTHPVPRKFIAQRSADKCFHLILLFDLFDKAKLGN